MDKKSFSSQTIMLLKGELSLFTSQHLRQLLRNNHTNVHLHHPARSNQFNECSISLGVVGPCPTRQVQIPTKETERQEASWTRPLEGPGSLSGLKEPSNNPKRLKNQLNPPSEPVHCLQQSSVPTLTNKLKETVNESHQKGGC
ncbi:hypothetical protein BCR33DRAFT_288766 [Rhizoclosmatium globosum]|uniref:Uncharacterized protein n=1 Tax=Rhizoclosmatium globosum TaxID=329046 RepID=A0A1Y2C798_9FUNG|nr:hypothetical protein BCR33DRAFT_288766 [Rhizoclosmatium globosum]|eukprot:ORY42909.1 hypothetical protein BCR33DRAFT_288766 [Rhizoclosmatium globosum]